MNYDKYQFVLDWDELPEDFKEEKITEYIEKGEKNECKECDGIGTQPMEIAGKEGVICESCKGTGEVNPDPDDQEQRKDAERDIEAHFPIYF